MLSVHSALWRFLLWNILAKGLILCILKVACVGRGMAEGGLKVPNSSSKTSPGDATYSILNVVSNILVYLEVS